MRVLMITGDKRMTTPGTFANLRYKLQASQVDALDVLLWPQAGIVKPLYIRGQYDVVTSQDPFWRGLMGWIVAKRLGAKLNVQVHADLDVQSLVKHILSQIVLRHADSVRVVSKDLKKQVERIGVTAKISVLPIFVDVEKYRTAQPKEHPQKTILWTGRFEKEKDPLQAVEVLAEVRKDGVDAKLVMIGEGSMKDDLVRRAHGLPVEIIPWQQEMLPHLEVADVVLSTSPKESWGASIVEALAAGLPVVSMDVGIAKEAGALVVEKDTLAKKTLEVLREGIHCHLNLHLYSKDEWARAWRETL